MRHKKEKIVNNRGFTLIEIMVVVVIIGIMASVISYNLLGNVDKARVTKAKNDMMMFSNALTMYNIDNNMYPTTEQGLKALIEQPTSDPIPTSWQPGGYLRLSTMPNDPWDTPYIYRSSGDNGEDFVIISLGKDKREGGEDYNTDIRYPDQQ